MKTLDEVIKGFKCCQEINCAECPYANWDNTDVVHCNDTKKEDDALYYLKHLKDCYEISANGGLLTPEPRSAEIGSGVEIKWHEPNPPLTWDELKQMEGKPVWVEGEHGFIWNHRSWVLIDPYDENDDLIICHGTDTGHYEFAIGKEDYGTDWQAYRKERK